jgi:hypothetical protein
MRKVSAAAALAATVSIATLAFAQTKPLNQTDQNQPQPQLALQQSASVSDARSLASDADVADARRTYRAACDVYQSTAYCECVTAGVAQALMPQEVRIAASTIGERINAQGDAAIASESDNTGGAQSSAERIEQIEGHYAAACWSYRD